MMDGFQWRDFWAEFSLAILAIVGGVVAKVVSGRKAAKELAEADTQTATPAKPDPKIDVELLSGIAGRMGQFIVDMEVLAVNEERKARMREELYDKGESQREGRRRESEERFARHERMIDDIQAEAQRTNQKLDRVAEGLANLVGVVEGRNS